MGGDGSIDGVTIIWNGSTGGGVTIAGDVGSVKSFCNIWNKKRLPLVDKCVTNLSWIKNKDLA